MDGNTSVLTLVRMQASACRILYTFAQATLWTHPPITPFWPSRSKRTEPKNRAQEQSPELNCDVCIPWHLKATEPVSRKRQDSDIFSATIFSFRSCHFSFPVLSAMAWNWAPPKVQGLVYQAQDITFAEWISLLTLCFAPLIAHILAGAPQPIYLCKTRPRWHDYLCIYSPISIAWRYAAITDRYIRTRRWNAQDMAAANAIFWVSSDKVDNKSGATVETGHWDGTEEMAAKSDQYITATSPTTHARILSGEFIKTAIVTLQGVQAIYVFVGGIVGITKMPRFALDTLFFAAAFLGLLRLCAAFWLTSEYAYIVRGDKSEPFSNNKQIPRDEIPRDDGGEAQDEPLTGSPNRRRVRPPSFWLSRVFRFLYIIPVFAFWFITLLFLIPGPWQGSNYKDGRPFTLTVIIGAIYIVLFFFAIIVIYGYYSWHLNTSTIIPCVDKVWYKVLVTVGFVALIPLLVVSAMETRKTRCGVYTTAGEERDDYICGVLNSTVSG